MIRPVRGSSRFLLTCLALALLFPAAWLGHAAQQASSFFEGAVIISEVGWSGTDASSNDEWLELHNRSDNPVDLSGWTLTSADGTPAINLSGTVPALGFFLLERTDDTTISDVPADQIYTGALNNSGDQLTLRDPDGATIDTANQDGGDWPAGSNSPKLSMERASPDAGDTSAGWTSNDGVTRNGLDANGNLISGTPGQPNSGWSVEPPAEEADLAVTKSGPPTIQPGDLFEYALTLQNQGAITAANTLLTDTLPLGVHYLSDTSGVNPNQPQPGVLVWSLGAMPPGASLPFTLTVSADNSLKGTVTNAVTAGTDSAETILDNNSDYHTSAVDLPAPDSLLINAVLFDGYELFDADEAVQLINIGELPVNLSGWSISDGGPPKEIPAAILNPGEAAWLASAGNAAAFSRQFGFAPDLLLDGWPGFANSGDEVILLRPDGTLADLLAYGSGGGVAEGWIGERLRPFPPEGSNVFGREGQILYRKIDQTTADPFPDSNTRADWAQDPADPVDGRKVRYPGWDLEAFFFPTHFTQTSEITLGIAPDNAYETLEALIDAAQHSIQLETLSITNHKLMEAFVRAVERGVNVTILMEGEPAGPDIKDQRNHLCGLLAAAGPGSGACWFMHTRDEEQIYDRYRNLHAKFIVIDWELYDPVPALNGSRAVISSENLSGNSMPFDDKSDGTWGRRGLLLATDAPAVVAHLQAVFSADFDPTHHADLIQWHPDDPDFGDPPAGFVPVTESGGITYTVRYPTAATFQGTFDFEFVQSPETSTRTQDALFGLLAQAGPGDTIRSQQLDERIAWGDDPASEPSLRFQAYVEAARRGATVRLMLDRYFSDTFYTDPADPTTNPFVCDFVNELARVEALDLECVLSNPTGLGIHNKMILVELNGTGHVHIGSINGSEAAHKINREVALQITSNALHVFLAEMFDSDYSYTVQLPVLLSHYRGVANHLLISEIMYNGNSNGGTVEEDEFIEIVNPTIRPVDLTEYSLSDAATPESFADLRRFPPGTTIGPRHTIVVALRAEAFFATFNALPDFEIVDSRSDVPNMIDDPAWGDLDQFLQLGNRGDLVILRGDGGVIVDAIGYLDEENPPGDTLRAEIEYFVAANGLTSCSLLPGFVGLERQPYWLDTGDCSADFISVLNPTPGTLP